MSAELLRRAAKVLRDHANGVTPTKPWKNSCVHPFMDGSSQFRISPWPSAPAVASGTAKGGVPEYIALMHPPVALALADLLDACVVAEDPDIPLMSTDHKLLALARAVLREEATS